MNKLGTKIGYNDADIAAMVELNEILIDGLDTIDGAFVVLKDDVCLLYTSPSPRDRTRSRMPSSA